MKYLSSSVGIKIYLKTINADVSERKRAKADVGHWNRRWKNRCDQLFTLEQLLIWLACNIVHISEKSDSYLQTMAPLSSHIISVVVLEIPLAILTIIGNLIFIVTLIKTRGLHTPSNVLIGTLCISDLTVGLLLQPILLTHLLQYEYGVKSCSLRMAYIYICRITTGFSFLCFTLISLDRSTAICYPFKYQRLASCKRHIYITVVASCIWLAYGSLSHIRSLARFWSLSVAIYQMLAVCAIVFCYYRIYKVIAHHKPAVRPISIGNEEEARQVQDTKRERKNTYTIAIILGFFLTCYMPYIGLTFFRVNKFALSCIPPEQMFIVELWVDFFVISNSSVNPIVYCFHSTEIRNAAARLCGIRWLSQSGENNGESTRTRNQPPNWQSTCIIFFAGGCVGLRLFISTAIRNLRA